MNRKDIVDKIKDKKVQDYTLTIVFFIMFAFFVFFAIRPNILTAFNLRKELSELRLKDKQFEDTILKIVEYQSILAANRDNFFLLDEALPETPQIYKVIDDVRKTASASSVIASRINVEEINLQGLKKNPRKKSYIVTMDATASTQELKLFIKNLSTQRRLKTIKNLDITRDDKAEGQKYNVQFVVEGFYL